MRLLLRPLTAATLLPALNEGVGALPFWTEANLSTDLEASRERLATCCQPPGNREGPVRAPVGTLQDQCDGARVNFEIS